MTGCGRLRLAAVAPGLKRPVQRLIRVVRCYGVRLHLRVIPGKGKPGVQSKRPRGTVLKPDGSGAFFRADKGVVGAQFRECDQALPGFQADRKHRAGVSGRWWKYFDKFMRTVGVCRVELEVQTWYRQHCQAAPACRRSRPGWEGSTDGCGIYRSLI